MNNKINIGIIGFGKMGKIRYDCLKNINSVAIKYIAEENSDINIPPNLKVKNVDVIFNDSEVDAIIICTPNFLNYNYTKKGLINGKNVFCEKPPAFKSEEILEIKKLEKLNKKFVMYGFNHRQHESVKLIKKYIDSDKFGKILWMRGRYGKSVNKDFFNSWRSDKKLSGGGILFDQGIHMLDLFLHFAGEFDQVKSFISNSYWNLDIEDNVFAIFKNSEKNITASLHSTMTQWRHLFSLEIFLEKGYIVLNGLKTSSGTYGKESLSVALNRSSAPEASWDKEDIQVFDGADFWQEEINEFVNCCTKNHILAFGDSSQALKVLKLIEKIYDEAKN